MLYKTAAYVYLVALTMTLLFTTPQAGINMEIAKETMTIIFNRLIRIVLKDGSKNLEDLMKITDLLVTATPLENYMIKAAEDENVCQCMKDAITEYEKNFRQLLSDNRDEQTEVLTDIRDEQTEVLTDIRDEQTEDKIPIYKTLKKLEKLCISTYGQKSTSQTAHTTQGVKASTSLIQFLIREPDENTSNTRITLRRLLEEEDEVPMPRGDEDETDESGFKIKRGILEVQILLDQFIQLALHKKCNNLENLKDFAHSMTFCTSFYTAVLAAAPRYKNDIKRYICEYQDDFARTLLYGGGGADGMEALRRNIPIYGKLNDILISSEKDPAASSSTTGGFPSQT